MRKSLHLQRTAGLPILLLQKPGKALSDKYNKQYFTILSGYVDSIPDEDILCTIRTMEELYKNYVKGEN